MSKMACLVIATAMLVSMSYATREQIGIWKDSIVLWKYVIGKEPGRVAIAHNNLGNAYSSEGQFDVAIEQFQTALRLKPDYTMAHYNLGVAYSSQGLFDVAIEQYQIALSLKPDYADAHFNLGLIYLNNGSIDMARSEYELGLSIKPSDDEARQVLNSIISRKH